MVFLQLDGFLGLLPALIRWQKDLGARIRYLVNFFVAQQNTETIMMSMAHAGKE
jgi:hypothetical protein